MISVCATTYNGIRYIKHQVNSILHQLPIGGQLIIADDGSSDGTIEYLKTLSDSRVILLPQIGRSGIVRNFERAIAAAQNGIIFLADQDDVWFSNKIERVLDEFKEDATLVVHNATIVNQHLRPTGDHYFDRLKPSKSTVRNLYRNTLIGAMMSFRSDLRDQILPFPARICMHDIWIGLVVCATGSIRFIDEPLMMYRRHDNNASTTLGRSKRPIVHRLGERVYTSIQLGRRIHEARALKK